jgi:aminoglycoside-2''-adenylyltransferase
MSLPTTASCEQGGAMSEPGVPSVAAAANPEPLPRTSQEAAETEYWAHLYGRWDPLDPAGVALFMNGFTRPWWVVGGWAIDAFTGVRRRHDDVDVSIFASDVPALREHVGDRWHLWSLADGDMRPLTYRHPEVFHPASQLWVRKHSGAPWVIDLPLTPDRDGLWTNKFVADHVGPIEEVTWLADDQVRYLNPEIVLLFKARLRRAKDEQDLARTWPLLTEEKQVWLREMIHRTDANHPWLGQSGL